MRRIRFWALPRFLVGFGGMLLSGQQNLEFATELRNEVAWPMKKISTLHPYRTAILAHMPVAFIEGVQLK